ncbi:hypothetical protein [Jiangella endophytica]|uniref:hypothetical protein n=1 Tax=Jiangella endophytica TaxID=1623398 RepID=UPI000E354335|nr:hypothetical protein [Jiangella endophytica]
MTAAPEYPRRFPPPLSRRSFLGGVGAATATLAGVAAGAPRAFATSAGTVLPLVAVLPAGEPDRTAFAPREQVFGSYLMILAPLANSVVDDDPELYGWMEDGWWRTPNDPRNSRIMEHVATLSWFLTHDRPWNPYHLDPNLLGRLDAALTYYLGLQGPTGAWPVTYQEESLATTGFGLVALGAVYRDLDEAGLLPQRRTELAASMRAAATWLMDTSRWHWNLPLELVNQLVGGLAGVAQAAAVLGDASIAAGLDDRIALLAEHGQAPAGYFHEPLGFDLGYNYEVMLPDLGDLYEWTGHPLLVEMARRWADFAQYVLLPEPGAPGWVSYGAACMRNSASTRTDDAADDRDRAALGRLFVADVPALGAFHMSAEAKTAGRTAWAADPAPVPPRVKGDTSPRLYMHVPRAPRNVAESERRALIADLRPGRDQVFTEYRRGTIDQQLLFVRRPGYYLAALLGERGSARVRSGPGLLWHPDTGAIVASFNNADDDHWTTVTAAGVDAALTDVVATFHDGAGPGGPALDPSLLGAVAGVFTGRYVSGGGTVTTDVVHRHDGIARTVQAAGPATEVVPLMVQAGDVLEFADGTRVPPGTTATATATGFSLTRRGLRVQFSWGAERAASLTATGRRYFPDRTHEHHVLRVEHDGGLTVEITTVSLADAGGDEVAAAATAHEWTGPDGAAGLAVHVVNLEPAPVDVRVVTSAGTRLFTDVGPGGGAYAVFMARSPVRAAVVTVTSRGSRIRVATRRLLP